MTTWQQRTLALAQRPEQGGLTGWTSSRDHKRIGLLTIGTALGLFLLMGALALTMRTQLAQPNEHVVGAAVYDQLFTIHGSGMIYLVVTPLAIGLGVYVVPLQVGAPVIAAPRLTLIGYWMYAFGAACVLSGFLTADGAAADGWTAYAPLSDSQQSPGVGFDLWLVGTFLATVGMMCQGGTVLWTVLRLRAPQMSMMRVPVFSWSEVATCLMVIMAFPSLLTALGMLAIGRIHPQVFDSNVWNIGYQDLFWFYGHPVVYVMFFPFVGAVAEVLATFARRKYFGYTATVLALLAFAGLSMSVWGHHMFTTGQNADDYYSLTSTLLAIPAGLEYFGFLGTIVGGRLSYRTPMLFALAFIPQFLVGGLTGIMVSTPAIDAQFQDTYFVVAHFHYTLFAGSVFGLFAGLYYWFPKMTGYMFDERLGRLHFVLMVIGTNVTFLPMFGLGFMGMPRRISSYSEPGWGTLNLVSSIGAFTIGLSMLVLIYNVIRTFMNKIPAGDDPWGGTTVEWATSSPPPRFNFDAAHPLPPITGFAPLLDLREREQEQQRELAGSGSTS
ncbi:MAG TPA: cbb3-type cytochrome c oxidase subunit I [Jatrophihabitans sp.]|nr:cbb3-type cytochrome c oxidase subunit I [Jatrophihabitans sp.]